MSCAKNNRVPNFTSSEKELLMRIIVNKYAGILEDKKTNRASSTQKGNAWYAIENEFNASSSCNTYRTAISLKKCYENRKKEMRKTLAEERKETIVTGGGPPPKIRKVESDDILRSILNEKTLVGLHNRFDDDADVSFIEFTQQENNDISTEYIYEAEEVGDKYRDSTQGLQNTNTSTNVTDSGAVRAMSQIKPNDAENCSEANLESDAANNWTKYTPAKLQTSVSAPLRLTESEPGKNASCGDNKTPKKNSRRRPATIIKPMTSSHIAKKYDVLLDKRLQIVESQLKHMETENALIIKKRKLEIEILEIELARKKQNL